MRASLRALSVLFALAAIVLGARQSWPDLTHERAHLTKAEALEATALHEHLPVALFDRWKAELHPGERYWFTAPPGASVGLTNEGAVYRTFALYWFLPNLPARSKSDASVLFDTFGAPR